ncbi:hypothetical protein [Mycobacterium sp.]|uniref:hypothetical protein n=1 Tax=Mycobacterium sp. TaxID=1785 RepID=UPI003F9C3078
MTAAPSPQVANTSGGSAGAAGFDVPANHSKGGDGGNALLIGNGGAGGNSYFADGTVGQGGNGGLLLGVPGPNGMT